MEKMLLFAVFASALLFLAGCSAIPQQAVSANQAIIYKSPSCDCCSAYGQYLSSWGFNVSTKNVDISKIYAEYNVPQIMQSCHLVKLKDYFIIGHVPKAAIDKMLSTHPDIDGIALPDMPTGTPGMAGPKPNNYTIYAIKNGNYSVFMTINN